MSHRTLSDLLRSYDVPPQLHDRLARVVYNLGGGRVPFVLSTTLLGNLNNAVETAVCTTPPLNPGLDSAVVLVLGCYALGALGATGGALQTQVRRGADVTGVALFPTGTLVVAAGGSALVTIIVSDTPGAVAGVQYTMSGRAVGATAPSALVTTLLIALALG
jgi:hypothetical protein